MGRSLTFYLIAGAVAAYTVYQSFFADKHKQDDRPPSRSQSYESPRPPNRDDRPPSRSQSYESSRPPVRHSNEPQHRQNVDSYQGNLTLVEACASLRARAKQEGDLMSQCYRQSQEAYQRRDHAHAKALSNKGKLHAFRMEKLNAEASAAIFKENNQHIGRTGCEVDLHGLYVKEAITYSEKAIIDARRRGDSGVRLIVGQGNHSERGISRLKPAIQDDLQMRGHRVEVDPKNPGVLLVQLGSR